MLARVAGPFDIVSIDPLHEPPLLLELGVCSYAEGLGLLVARDETNGGEAFAVKPDGSAIYLGREVGGWGYSIPDALSAHTPYIGVGHWRARMPGFALSRSERYQATPGSGSFCIVPDPDRLLWLGDANVTVSPVEEYDADVIHGLSGFPNTGLGAVAYRGGVNGAHLFWCCNLNSGALACYDLTNDQEFGHRTSFGSAVRTMGYSRKHALFFVTRQSGGVEQLEIYSTEPVATTLSTPVFAEPPARGRSTLVSATLTGSDDEPCPGRHVTFACTVGELERATVETDEDGVASTRFYAPTSTATAATVTARLED